MLSREITASDINDLPGVDDKRLVILDVTGPGAEEYVQLRAHLAAAPYVAVDSEGTFDKAMRRDRMCLLSIMAPACKGHPKGEPRSQGPQGAARCCGIWSDDVCDDVCDYGGGGARGIPRVGVEGRPWVGNHALDRGPNRERAEKGMTLCKEGLMACASTT